MTAAQHCIATALACFLTCTPHDGHLRRHRQPVSAKLPNKELIIAKIYAEKDDWKDAETHFIAAAADPAAQAEALAGLKRSRQEMEDSLAAPLAAAEVYEKASLWSKSENIYRSVVTDTNSTDPLRDRGKEGLKRVLEKQELGHKVGEWWERTKTGLEMLAAVLGLTLLFATLHRTAKGRKKIVVQTFAAPSDELERSVALEFRYARETMANPALSSAGLFPATLVNEMFEFAEEAEAIEDVEIAGATLPFAALAKLFGRPRVTIHGGFDGGTPNGEIWASIRSVKREDDDFVTGAVAGPSAQQKSDLRNFAYTVYVRAASVYKNN